MKPITRSFVFGVGGTLLAIGSTLFAPLAAHASADGRKNTTIALGAAAAYELLVRHQVVPALVLGAGAAYADKRYEDARRDDRYNNYRDYNDNGNRSYRNYHDNGNHSYRDDNNSSYSNDNRDSGRPGQRPERDDYNQQGDWNQQERWSDQGNNQNQGRRNDGSSPDNR